jgi:hypothetical protein
MDCRDFVDNPWRSDLIERVRHMVAFEEIRSLVKAHPFKPFRLWYDEDGPYDVRDPQHVLLLQRYFIVGILAQNSSGDDFERHAVLWYPHIKHRETLTASESPPDLI